MQYDYCIIVLPTNLVLLVKQTQIATLELYRMHHAIHVLYVFMCKIAYFIQMAAGGEWKIESNQYVIDVPGFVKVKKLVVCYKQFRQKVSTWHPQLIYILSLTVIDT